MNTTIYRNGMDVHRNNISVHLTTIPIKCLLVMKFLAFYILVLCACSFGNIKAQKISLNVKNAAFQDVALSIQKQTGYSFSINKRYLQKAKPVTIQINQVDLNKALEQLFRDQPFTYTIDSKVITLIDKAPSTGKTLTEDQALQEVIRGRVTNERDEPLVGATIRVKGSNTIVKSDNNGHFELPVLYENATIQVVYIGYNTQELKLQGMSEIKLTASESLIDEVVTIAYGTTTRRLNTGAVSKVPLEELSKQPTNNLLGALSGRVPGLTVVQSSGVPGSSFSLQIRGRNSILQGSDPLILIDGIPFAPQNENINSMNTSIGNGQNGGLSPFFSINPSDIESIEVLKDADATAIYGSRGANGVILISTRKGQIGNTQITAGFSQGFSKTPKGMKLMNTEQYLDMRREAFANSNVTPNATNAPDLVEWDQNRYTDIRQELTGNTGSVSNAQLSLSGGNKGLQFLIGGSYYRETNVFPGELPNNRGSANFNLNHTSPNDRLKLQFSGGYTATANVSTGVDLSYYITIPPNAPSFFDDEGKLNWVDGIPNPYSFLYETYKAQTGNLTSSLNLSYSILPTLSMKVLMGYNEMNGKDKKLRPKIASRNEDSSTAHFGNSQYKTWNIEPQLEYKEKIGLGNLNVLIGTTFQQTLRTTDYIQVGGFPSDALIESQQAANTVISISNSYRQYRYQALFGRVNYNILDRYLINITGRRDGSSRFGPGQQYANFGAIGAGWIFSSKNAIKDIIPFLSYGKLRGSYGITGNDQIGDYQYLDAWRTRDGPDGIYQGVTALFPDNLYNPVYAWESNKKLEAALELGFLGDRLLLNVDFFKNRSGNQLIQYRMPYTTGFGSVLMNFPALVENKGLEILLNCDLIKTAHFNWKGAFNITYPKNKLLDFPDIESSSYSASYIIGEPLNILYNYRSLGVDPETGLYHFQDVDENGSLSARDYLLNGSLDPKYYGGIRNNFNYKGIELDVFFDFKNQTGRSYLHRMYQAGIERIPGTMFNQPVAVLDRWQNEGDVTNVEKFSYIASPNRSNVTISNALYSDQSFLRLRSIHLSYGFSSTLLSAIKAKRANVYMQGQNLYTWNKEKGYDPEVQDIFALAPLRTYTIGIQLTY